MGRWDITGKIILWLISEFAQLAGTLDQDIIGYGVANVEQSIVTDVVVRDVLVVVSTKQMLTWDILGKMKKNI